MVVQLTKVGIARGGQPWVQACVARRRHRQQPVALLVRGHRCKHDEEWLIAWLAEGLAARRVVEVVKSA